ncbi:hypothetical protein ACVR1I_02440 [Streptococcus cameli]
MGQEQQKRLIELYEKGVLTKEEAKACFLELEEAPDFVFVEEKARLAFTIPSLKVFATSKEKQNYHFKDIESMKISLSKGKLVFQKHKSETVRLSIVYPQSTAETSLPQIYVEKHALHFLSNVSCQLTIYLPENQWLSVLDLEIGESDARIDYLPFEDVSIHSHSDKKQQDIRVTADPEHNQHLHLVIQHAPIHLHVPKHQGLKGRLLGKKGLVQINRKMETSPYCCEKQGNTILYLQVETETSPLLMKGIKHVWNL